MVVTRRVGGARLPRISGRASALLCLSFPPLSVDVGRDLVPLLQGSRFPIRASHDLVDDGVLERRFVELDKRCVVEVRVDGPFLENAEVFLDREIALLHHLDLGLRRLGDVNVLERLDQRLEERLEAVHRPYIRRERGVREAPVLVFGALVIRLFVPLRRRLFQEG